VLQPSPLSPSFTHYLPCSGGETALKDAIDLNQADVAAYLRNCTRPAVASLREVNFNTSIFHNHICTLMQLEAAQAKQVIE
jgi:hypothetical protein